MRKNKEVKIIMTKIIMDSTSDLPKNIIEKYDIDILPLRVYVNNKEYLDKITIG